jgi:hypothetical protein
LSRLAVNAGIPPPLEILIGLATLAATPLVARTFPLAATAGMPPWEAQEDKEVYLSLMVCFDKADEEDNKGDDEGDSWKTPDPFYCSLRWRMKSGVGGSAVKGPQLQ